MKYKELTFGQMEAIVNKLGGMEGVKRFLSEKPESGSKEALAYKFGSPEPIGGYITIELNRSIDKAPGKASLEAALRKVSGVDRVSINSYSIELTKARSFRWDEIIVLILGAIRAELDANGPELKSPGFLSMLNLRTGAWF